MAARGMNMRDMKARSLDAKVRQRPASLGTHPSDVSAKPRRSKLELPNTGRQGLGRGTKTARATGHERAGKRDDEGGGDEPELLDELDEAVHSAQSDGHFAPSARRYQRDDDEHDCPDEPPPGWGGDE